MVKKLILSIVFALFFLGCSRSVHLDKTKEKKTEYDKTVISDEEFTKQSEHFYNEINKGYEMLNQKVTELYDENGVLISRIAELSKETKTDKNITDKKTYILKKRLLGVYITKHIETTKTVKIKDTTKKTNTIFILCIGFLIGILFAFFVNRII